MEHHFAEQILSASGCNPLHPEKNVMNILDQRQNGRSFGPQTKCNVLGRYLPTNPTLLESYDSQIFCGRFSKTGDVFMSACQDRHLRLYNTQNWKMIKEIVARDVGWSIIDTDYSPDQRWLIYSSWSDYVQLCNIGGEHEVHEGLDLKPEAHRFCLFSIKFSPDSNEILCGSSDKSLYIYNLDRREVSLKVEGHKDDVNTVCYAEENNNNTIFSGSDDTLCKVWDRRLLGKGNTPVGCMVGHFEGITHICSKGDGRYFISNSKDQSIKLWDIRMMKENDTAETEAKAHRANYDYRYGDSYLARGQRNAFSGKKMHPGDTSLMTYRGHKVFQTLIRSYFSPMESTGQRYIYAGSFDGILYVYDVLTGEIIQQLAGHRTIIRDSSWHPYQPLLATTSWDGCVKLWTHEKDGVMQAKKRRKERK